MKSILQFFLFIVVCFAGSQANAQKKQQKKSGSSKDEQSLIWEITGNGLTTPSYLFGTIHLICKEDFFWNKNFEQAFLNTQQLCLEIDMSDQMAMMSAVMLMMNQDGVLLSSYFTQDEQSKLDAYLQQKISTSLENINQLKPMFLISIFASDMQICATGSTESYESYLLKKAQEKEFKILGIESVNAQIEALASIPDSSIISYAKLFLNESKDNKELEKATKQMQNLIGYYKTQNIEEIYNITVNNQTDFNMNLNVLLNDRNEDWIPKMTDIMKNKATFFAFGAAHLSGDKGVINLLRKAGFTLKPVLSK